MSWTPNALGKIRDVIAPAFSESTAYAVGNYVLYDGAFYKCIVAHPAGAWDATHFAITKVSNEFGGGGGGAVQSVNGKTGIVTLNSSEIPLADATGSVEDAINTKAKSTSVAEEFLTSKAYVVDDLVMHNSRLYKAKENIPAGTWDASKWQTTAIANELGGDVDFTCIAPAYDETATYTVGKFVTVDDKLYYCITAVETPEPFDSTKWVIRNIINDVANAGTGFVIRNSVGLSAFLTGKAGITVKRITVQNYGMSYTGEMPQHTYTFFVGERDVYMDTVNFTINYVHNDSITSVFKNCSFYNMNIIVKIDASSGNFTAASPFTFFENCKFYNCYVTTTIGDKYVPATKVAANRMSGFKMCSFYNTSASCTIKITDAALYNSDIVTGFDTCINFVGCPFVTVTANIIPAITTLRCSAAIGITGNVDSSNFNFGASGEGISCIAAGFSFAGRQQITGNYFSPNGSSYFKGTSIYLCDFGPCAVSGNYFNYSMDEMHIRIGRGCAFTGNFVYTGKSKKILVLTDGKDESTGLARSNAPTAHTITGNTIYYVPSTATGIVAGDCIVIDANNLTTFNTHGVNITGNNITIYSSNNLKANIPVRCISKASGFNRFVVSNNTITDERAAAVTVTGTNTAFYNGDNVALNVITGFSSAFEDEAGHTPTSCFNNIIS